LFLALGIAIAPDPGGAAYALVDSSLRVSGDLCGGAGLLSGAGVATSADAIGLLDDNRITGPWLHGVLSRPIQRGAMALSWTGTSALEALRGEDIERLPEAPATHLEAAPFIGRLDSALSGVSALWLAGYDALTAPALAGLRLVGAAALAERLERARTEARERALGPEPLPPRGPLD
jgi:hypothetical protein